MIGVSEKQKGLLRRVIGAYRTPTLTTPYINPPTDQEWKDAYVNGEFGEKDDAGQEEFIRGCKDGWKKSGGAKKL